MSQAPHYDDYGHINSKCMKQRMQKHAKTKDSEKFKIR